MQVEVKKYYILVRVVLVEVMEHKMNSSNILQDVVFVVSTAGGVFNVERGRYWDGRWKRCDEGTTTYGRVIAKIGSNFNGRRGV